jgi:HemX protein
MTIAILRIAALLYAAAAAAYVFHFVRPRHARAASLGFGLLVAAFVVHVLSIGWGCAEFGGWEFFNLRGGLGMVGWLAAGALLVLLRLYSMPGLAAFVLPLVLVSLLPGVFGAIGSRSGSLPEEVRRPAVTVHISVAAGSVALFAIAFGVALMYLLQEREVKGKHFGALFSRLPSLDALDRLTQRLVRAGLAVWSVALVTGALIAQHVWGKGWTWDVQLLFSLVVWALYFALVWMRHRGIHGRRFALLTVVGFTVILGSMIGLKAVPDITQHQGAFTRREAVR